MEFLNISLTKDLSLLLHASGQSTLASTGGFYRKPNSTLVLKIKNPYKKSDMKEENFINSI
jgi:hypothetical protein